eukprot:8738872-Pyramimonas_sp.AAC.1
MYFQTGTTDQTPKRKLRLCPSYVVGGKLEELVVTYIDQLGDADQADFLHAVSNMPAVLGGLGMEVWSLCTGTGIMHHAQQAIEAVLSQKYSIFLKHQHVLACEQDPRKRKFVIAELGVPFVAESMEELSKTTALNYSVDFNKPTMETLPRAVFMEVGFP